MNARGTRRPHKTRPYKRGRSPSRSGGGKKGKGCGLFLLAFAALPAMVWELIAITTR